MDDILILAPTRWKLRGAVRVVNEVLASLRLEKHPDKTTIGRIKNGFDFLGYHFGPGGVSVAKQTLVKFVTKASRLYEQERVGACAPDVLGMYVRRWARAGFCEVAAIEKTATQQDRRIAYASVRRVVRQWPSAFCASR